MQIDFSQEIVGFDGEVIKDQRGPLTLGRVCGIALTSQGQNEKNDGEEKLKRFLLAQKIFGKETVSVTVDEVSLMKKLVNESFGAAVMGPAWLMLEPPEKPKRDSSKGNSKSKSSKTEAKPKITPAATTN